MDYYLYSSIQRADPPAAGRRSPKEHRRVAANRRRWSDATVLVPSFPPASCPRLQCQRRRLRPRPLASMLHAARRWTPPLPATLAAAFFSSKPQPQRPRQLLTPQLVDAVVSRCPSDGLALSFFLWCARRPGNFHPPSSFDRLLPAATRIASRLGTAHALLRELQRLGCPIKPRTFHLLCSGSTGAGSSTLSCKSCSIKCASGNSTPTPSLGMLSSSPRHRAQQRPFRRRRGAVRSAALPRAQLPYIRHCAHSSLQGERLARATGVRSYFIEMLRQGFQPSSASLTAVLACCSKAGTMYELLQLLSFALVLGCKLTSAMWTCLIVRL
uniref:Pentacotripeptide-repeat region of PRORP domain-containing protein n=1 Tax=Setaria viridis TaxID=4556 RepID=A0A4V6D1H6_SETVI|nr:uncharacterized protein LOC117838825 [Setaria viridis]TKV94695.1 hypothetical protein SEVIR_9G312366v2 [Setaria viridis]